MGADLDRGSETVEGGWGMRIRRTAGRGGRSVAAWTDRMPVYAAVLSGLLLALSFPPFDQPWLQIPAWMLLLRLSRTSRTRREMALRVSAATLAWNLGATYWLMMATVSGGVAAIGANSLLMVLPWLVIRAVQRRKWAPGWQVPAIAGVWTAFEFGHHHWALSWPWLTLANAWSVWPNAIQWIEWTGHLGVSFWVVSVAVLLERAWWESGGPVGHGAARTDGGLTERAAQGMARGAAAGMARGAAAAALLPIAVHGSLGALGMAVPGADPVRADGARAGSEAVTVTVLQPDHNSLLPYGGQGDAEALVDTLLAKSEQALGAGGGRSDLLIWPENAVDAAVTVDSWLSRRIGEAAAEWNTAVLTGMIAVETYAPGEAPHLHRGDPERSPYNVFNSAVFYSSGEPSGPDGTLPDGEAGGASDPVVYHKANLVPVVERFPFVDVLARLPLLERIDWTGIMGYGKGERAQMFTLPSGVRMFGLICYDSVYSDWTRAFVRQGAGFISVITNDGWWGNTSGHVQHFEFARLRAIEFRRTVIRSANNGTSGVILPDGSVRIRTPYAVQDAFTVEIRPRGALTFYAKAGNWVGWGSLGAALAALVALALGRIKPGSVGADVDADVEADVVGGPLERSG